MPATKSQAVTTRELTYDEFMRLPATMQRCEVMGSE